MRLAETIGDRADYFLSPGLPARRIDIGAGIRADDPPPLITCIMASRGRLFPAVHAIDCFRRQSYPHRELVIATAARDDVLGRYIRGLGDASVRLVEVPGVETVGRLRNVAVAEGRGRLIAVWDDDDLSCPDRLAHQYQAMTAAGAAGCFLARELLWWPARRRLAASSARIWENSMLVHRADLPAYREDGAPGEDTDVAAALRARRPLLLVDRPDAYLYVAHGGNLCSAAHFEMLFDHSSRQFTGPLYDDVLGRLAATMPVTAYAAGIASRDGDAP